MQFDGQKSLRDYFTGEKQTTVSSPASGVKRSMSIDRTEPSPSSTPAKRKPLSRNSVVIIDSDLDEDEENIFQCSTTKFRDSNFALSPSSERNVFGIQSKPFLSASASKKRNTRVRPAGKWSCSACTYSNHPLISYCEMCNTRRDSQPACDSTEPLTLRNSSLLASPSSETSSTSSSGAVSKLPCSTKNLSNHSPTNETATVAHSNFVAGSLSEVRGSFASNSGYSEVVSKLPSGEQNSSLSLESETWLPSFTPEFNIDEIVEMSETNELSNCTSPAFSTVGKNTSRLKKLNINSDQVTDDRMSDSFVDKQQFVTEVESCLQSDTDFSNTPVHDLFQFSCSRNSSRIYVYDKVYLPPHFILQVTEFALLFSKMRSFCKFFRKHFLICGCLLHMVCVVYLIGSPSFQRYT